MLDRKQAPHTIENYRALTNEGHVFLLDKTARRERNEIPASGFRVAARGNGEAVKNALKDLEDFFAHSFRKPFRGDGLSFRVETGNGAGKSAQYAIAIDDSGVKVCAETPRGAARALFRIQSMLRLRRAPFLKKGVFDSKTSLDPALAYPAFKSHSTTDFSDPEAYHENYLKRLARAGYTGFHLNLDIAIFYHSALLPEFNCANVQKNLETLRKIIRQAGRFGLEVFLSLYLEPLKGDHPVFKRLPEIRGSRFVGTDDAYILCSSHPRVREFYAEQLGFLFRNAPELGGLLLISGCEGWLHCHTACAQTKESLCDCPRCAPLPPEQTVAEMFNQMASAVKKVQPEARVIVWNYGIFAWTDIRAQKFISLLSKDCEVMANFDTGDDFPLEGVQGTCFDYSLRCVGPSEPFLAQSRLADRRGLVMHAKCESGTPLEYCSLQYVPAMTRWHRKFAAILDSGVSGALFNWKFMGFTEGLSQELAGLMSCGERDRILGRLAARHFGRDNVRLLLKAWRAFDRAMDYHPFSIGSAGYFKGPFYIGPAQPLFPTPELPADLPECFFWKRGGRPLCMTTLSFVEPFGVKAFLRAVRKLEKHWTDGCNWTEKVNPHPEDPYLKKEIESHRALCRLFLCFIRTALHMTEFYCLRDSFQQEPYSPEQAREKLEAMRDIAREELTNTERALELVRTDHRIAFSYSYHYGISEKMCLYKLAHTKKLIEHTLPQKYYGITFNRNRHPVWL